MRHPPIPWIACASVLASLLLCGGVMAQPPTSEQEAMGRFHARIDAYVLLHREVERDVPALRMFSDSHEATEAFEAMTRAMQASRSGAREGEIFDGEVGRFLRQRIMQVLADHQIAADDLLDEWQDARPADGWTPVVNGTFEWASGNMMPPCVLAVLPDVPAELEYRLIGVDLVLIDVHAGLVVDVLRDAIVRGTVRS